MQIHLGVEPGEVVADKREVVMDAIERLLDRMVAQQSAGLAKADAEPKLEPEPGRDMQIKPHSVAPLNTLRLDMLRGYYEQMQSMKEQLVAAIEAVTQGKDIDVDKPFKPKAKEGNA